jgi:N-acetylglucosamine-6-phosphate deacetylase
MRAEWTSDVTPCPRLLNVSFPSDEARDGTAIATHYRTGRTVRVRWANGLLRELSETSEAPHEAVWVAPPLFDVQVNGYAGVDFQQDNLSAEELLHAVSALRRDACGRFLLTLITAEWPVLLQRLRRCAELRTTHPLLASAIVGFHIEGPFLSSKPGFCGAHEPAWMIDPSPAHVRELRAAAGDVPLLLTLAPEREGALEAIREAARLNVRVSLGHTDAPAEILRGAVQAGAVAFTHLGNGCPRELDRHDNILWRVADVEGFSASLIPDGIHVSPSAFRTLHRCLGARAFYTTDAMSAAGAPPGRYTLGQIMVEVGDDRIVRQPGKANFAGSALRPVEGVLRAAEMLNSPWQQCWLRFSEKPAEVFGISHTLAAGQPFCFVRPS